MASFLNNIQNRIYVGNLLAEISPAFLFKIFSSYGKVVSVQKKYPTYAFVEYDNQISAQNAIFNTNGIELCGRKIFVNKVKIEGKNNEENCEIKKEAQNGEKLDRMDIDNSDETPSGENQK
jgi:RNA recognition motif-containing protein